MGVGAGLYIYDVVVKSSRSVSHLLMRSCEQMTAPVLSVIETVSVEWWNDSLIANVQPSSGYELAKDE